MAQPPIRLLPGALSLSLAILVSVLLGAYPLPASAVPQPVGANAHTPELLGQVAFPDKHPANDVVVAGRYAYVAYGDARFEGWGLRVVDVVNPRAPRLVGVYNIPHAPGTTGQVPSLAVAGSYVYLAAGSDGLRIVDVTNPAAPTEVAAYRPTGGYVWDVAVAGSFAYVAAEDAGLRVLNITNPRAPQEVGSYDACCILDVTVAGSFAYVNELSMQMSVVDISNPAQPVKVGAYDLSEGGTVGRHISAIAVEGNYAYITWGYCIRVCSGGLFVVDVSNPAAPTRIGRYGEELARPFGPIKVVGGYAYLGVDNGCTDAACSGTLRIVDVTNPAAPTLVSLYPLSPTGIDVAGALIYISDNGTNPYEHAGRVTVLRYVPHFANKVYLPIVHQ